MRRADIEVTNHPVDMDSWGRSACYPRGTFYPLSDTTSTSRCRITSPDFRPCSTCKSHSQAPFCLCTLRMVSNHPEGTFGRLRYPFGGDRPSQTPRLTLSHAQFHGLWLEIQYHKGGIPTAAPEGLASLPLRLPPILHNPNRTPIPSYSEGPGVFSSCRA